MAKRMTMAKLTNGGIAQLQQQPFSMQLKETTGTRIGGSSLILTPIRARTTPSQFDCAVSILDGQQDGNWR